MSNDARGTRPDPERRRAPRSHSGNRIRADQGVASSLSLALLTPLFVALAFAAFQAALWSHARTETRVIARDTAALVARAGVAPADAQRSAVTILSRDTALRDIRVHVTIDDDVVTVTIAADAPGVLIGTSRAIAVRAAVPFEAVVAP